MYNITKDDRGTFHAGLNNNLPLANSLFHGTLTQWRRYGMSMGGITYYE